MNEKNVGGRPRLYGTPTTIRLTVEQQQALVALAKQERRTFTDMLRLVLEKGLEGYGINVPDEADLATFEKPKPGPKGSR